jgi:transposase InsO family protein
MTDNAFAYTKSQAFQAVINELGARHVTTRPYRPRTNGKAERFIQTALREWLYAKPYRQSNERADDMPSWIHWYNHHRPHSALKAKAPASRLNNVLGNDSSARIGAGLPGRGAALAACRSPAPGR